MTKRDKIEWIKTHYWSEWVSIRQKVADKLSESQDIFCCCGALATGLHETQCRRFNDKVDSIACKELKHLLPER